MALETRDFSFWEAFVWIYQNNPNTISVHYNDKYEPDYLVSEIPIERLNLPDGWYFKKGKYITNQYNTTNKKYSCIKIFFKKI